MRIVILGAGFGGLEIAARLSDAVGDDLDCTLIDRADAFVFGYSKLDLLFGKTPTATSTSAASTSARSPSSRSTPGRARW
jgi:NADH dehydrogenase FAD-containing subunit